MHGNLTLTICLKDENASLADNIQGKLFLFFIRDKHGLAMQLFFSAISMWQLNDCD